MKRAVIVLGGCITDYEYTANLINTDDFIVCADGGLKHLEIMDIRPNVWIGDNDSAYLSPEKISILSENAEVIKLNPIKDATDGEEACKYVCSKKKFENVLIIGFFGNRIDHLIGNISLLKTFSDAGISAVAINENNAIYFGQKHNTLSAEGFKYVSLIPLSDTLNNTSTLGLKYKLTAETLYKYSTRGISNESIEDNFTIDIESGDALIILSKD